MRQFEMLLSASYLLFFGALAQAQFDIPDALVEVLSPKGLRVSIPDEEGIVLFGFHGQINSEMFGREEGTFSREIYKAVDGRWTFLDKTARLKVGDTIYYWIKVDYFDGVQKHGYYKDDQNYVITDLTQRFGGDSSSTNANTYSTTTTTSPTSISNIEQAPSTKPTTQRPVQITTPTTTENPNCKHTPTFVNGKRSCQGKLIFHETFGEISEKKWDAEIRFAGDPDYEFVVYHDDPETLYLEKRMLHIKPSLVEDKFGAGFVDGNQGLDLGENCTGVAESFDCVQKPKAWLIIPPVFSGQITTKNHFSFVYGTIEIRAKLPKGDWIYPELYLKSRNDDYGLGYKSGLIKIAFAPGNVALSKYLTGGCVLGDSVAARNYGIKSVHSEKNWNNDFHIFRMEWKTDSITLTVDGQVYGNIYPPEGGFASKALELEVDAAAAQRWKKGSELAPFDKEMYVVLGVGVGGQSFPNRKNGTKPWDNDDPKAQLHFYRAQDTWIKTWSDNSDMIVDYVKVWAL